MSQSLHCNYKSKIRKLFLGLVLTMILSTSLVWAVPILPQSAAIQEQANTLRTAPIVVPIPVQNNEARIPGFTTNIPSALHGQQGQWIAPHLDRANLDLQPVVWVDDNWSDQTSVDLFNPALIWQTDAFATVQDGIDNATAGGTVNVLPGTYNETATNRMVLGVNGPHQFGLFISIAKNGITVQGVDAVGTPITNSALVQAEVLYTATNNFGYSGIFIEGDNVTLTGLRVHNGPLQDYVDKTMEIIGDAFTMRYCQIDDWDTNYLYGGTVYFGDWRYNTIDDESYIKTFTITDNDFPRNNTIYMANGTGYGWPASGRVISGNTFDSYGEVYSAIAFTGTVPAYGWLVYPVSGAVISGNTFSNGTSQYIKARGIYDNSTFDWASYWNNNTFDRKVVHGSNPPGVINEYTYSVFAHTRRIGTVIQDEIYYAAPTETVLVGGGNYVENLTVDKALTLNGSGELSTKIYPAVSDPGLCGGSSFQNSQVIVVSASDVTISNLTVDGDNPALTSGVVAHGADLDARNGIIESSGPWNNTVVHHCTIKNLYLRGIYARSGGSGFNFHHNTVTNVDACYASIGMFNFGGSGIMEYNNVSYCGDAISSNWSRGTQFLHNTVTNSGSGVHTDNNGGSGGVADLIQDNHVSAGAANSYGVWVFFPYLNTVLDANDVTNNDVGLFAWGGAGGTGQFTNNIVDGQNRPNCLGIYVTSGLDAWASWQSNVSCSFSGNSTSNCTYGFGLETDENGDYGVSLTSSGYTQSGHTYDIYVAGLGPMTYTGLGGHTVLVGFPARAQDGINLALASIVYLSPGTYVGQLHITTNNLQLVGTGVATTTIQAPVGAMALAVSGVFKPVIFVDGASNVGIKTLTVDGAATAGVNTHLAGIAYWNSGGSVDTVNVVNVTGGTPGSNLGYGVYANNNDAVARTLNLDHVNASTYQDQGVTLRGANLASTLDQVNCTGSGTSPGVWQVGIEVGDITSADLATCATSNHSGDDGDAGVWINGQVDIATHTSTNDFWGIIFSDCEATNTVDNASVTQSVNWGGGLVAFNSAAALASIPGGKNPDARPTLSRLRHIAERNGTTRNSNRNLDNPTTVIVTNSDFAFTGPHGDYSEAVSSYSDGGSIDLQINNCTASGYEWGMGGQSDGGPGTTTITNTSITDNGAYAGIWLWATNYSSPSSQAGVFNGNTVIGALGRACEARDFGLGTITASITNNKFACPDNSYDDHSAYVAGRWDQNCYSDYGLSHAGFMDYNINAGPQVDLNPNPNSCSDVDFILQDSYIGCSGTCTNDTLYLTLNQVNIVTGQIFIQLSPQLDADWTPGYGYNIAMPASNVAPNLAFAAARRDVNPNRLEVNVTFFPPYSNGDGSKYIACIPLKNVSGIHGQTLTAAGAGSTFLDAGSVAHVNEFILATANIYVDCDAPLATITGGAGEGSCNAYNSQADFLNHLTLAMNATGLNGNPVTPLNNAYIELNGSTQWTVSTAGGTFPAGGESPNVWNTMTEGCNTFVLHVFDVECNEGVSSTTTVVKDTQAPVFSPVSFFTQSSCYNNTVSDPQYGATLLNTDMDINVAAPLACQANSVTLKFTLNANTWTVYSNVGSISNYPSAAEAAAFWTQVVSILGGSYSGTANFTATVEDCAGNQTAYNFSMCIDMVPPSNTFTRFDAHPTYRGVWLDWVWTYNASQATAVEIYRKGEGDYPLYAADLWNADVNYEKVHSSLSGWALVASQTGPSNTSSAYAGTHHLTYWKDAFGTDAVPLRDIYRYITFVKDAANNWSQVGSYTICTNADRSTNYWLGDYSFHAGNPPVFGVVNTTDLSLLSSHYFATATGFEYLDIGPEAGASPCGNGIGKNIPNPDGFVNFNDLVPFSFNLGVAGPTGFSIQPHGSRPFEGLDAIPAISVSRFNQDVIEVGDGFSVIVSVSGNEHGFLKALEARLTFDENVLDLVSVTANEIQALDGVPWSIARAVPNSLNEVGIAAAAMGENGIISDNPVLATITFRYKSELVGSTEIALTTTHMADGNGATLDGAGNTLTLGALGSIPTEYALYQNYPNPFNPSTILAFDLKESGFVTLKVYNVLGQEAVSLVSANMQAGRHKVTFDATGFTSGLYVYVLEINEFRAQQKMLLVR